MQLTQQNKIGLRYAITLALVLAVTTATSNVLADCKFTFSDRDPESNTDLTRRVERAVARVYAADAAKADDKTKLGAAVTIHLNPMLLVTAGHVVKGNTAKINFPDWDQDDMFLATVVKRSTEKDFAVLRVEHSPRLGMQALEAWLGEVEPQYPHQLVGYARDSPAAFWGKGAKPAPTKGCEFRIREGTYNGDSGGAAISKEGLLVGIILDGREGGKYDDGAMGQATILPLGCVADTILFAIDEIAPKNKSNVLDASRRDLMQELKPPPSAGWIENLEFARGLRDAKTDRSLQEKLRSQRVAECPIFQAALDRKIGLERAMAFLQSVSKNTKDAGDILKHAADEQWNRNSTLAMHLYEAAAQSFNK